MMRRRVIRFGMGVGLLLLVSTLGAADVAAQGRYSASSLEAALTQLRSAAGVAQPLRHSGVLEDAAAAHAQALASSGRFSHDGADGSSPHTRVARAGKRSCRTAENIARGQGELQAVLSDWMASRGHRRNMVDPRLTHFGLARSGATWVLVLARPC